jgi:apolipoprotein N-acyltransferase
VAGETGASPRGPFPLPARLAYSGAVLTGLLYWLAFPGKLPIGSWHGLLSLITFIPLWLSLQGQTPRRALWVGVLAGATMNLAGFTWLLDMLEIFSGFPWYVCIFFVVVVCTYQGGRIGLMGWLYGRATARGWPRATVFVAAFVASELLYPLLFPWYFAATTHQLPALSQTAELGGPILVGAILVGVSVALAEPILARAERRTPRIDRVVVPLVVFAAALAFAAVRIPAVDREAQAGEPLHVGVVQGNLGLIQKREDPAEGLRRHLHLTSDLKDHGAELVVWSESSVTMSFPERGYGFMMKELFAQHIGVPAIIGSVLFAESGLQQTLYNTALSFDARGEVTGRYDKEFLLAFGEYLPFGELIPKLYDWSPNSGHFTPGKIIDPLPITIRGMTHPVSVLICYEDILPSFTNKVVAHARPELLVNMSNDAWFGDTAEPWEHVALAQLRAIEHRRYLVRSTNSGVSAVVDPVGRVMVHGGTFDAEAIDAIVHWQHNSTVYETIGDVPWYALSALLVVAAFVRRSKRSRAALVAGVAALGVVLVAAGVTGCSSSTSPTAPHPDAARTDAVAVAVTDAPTADADAPSGQDSGGVDAGVCPAIAGVLFGAITCDTCVANRCCSAATTCYALVNGDDSPCSLYANCLANCQMTDAGADGGLDADGPCNADCATEFPNTDQPFAAMQACIASQCTNDAGTAPCN